MKKIILSLAVIFVMSSFTTADTNSSIEKVNIEEVALKQIDPVTDCREYSHTMVRLIYMQNPSASFAFLDIVQQDLFVGCVERIV